MRAFRFLILAALLAPFLFLALVFAPLFGLPDVLNIGWASLSGGGFSY